MMWIKLSDNNMINISDAKRIYCGTLFIGGSVTHHITISSSREDRHRDDYIITLYYNDLLSMNDDYTAIQDMINSADKHIINMHIDGYVNGKQI